MKVTRKVLESLPDGIYGVIVVKVCVNDQALYTSDQIHIKYNGKFYYCGLLERFVYNKDAIDKLIQDKDSCGRDCTAKEMLQNLYFAYYDNYGQEYKLSAAITPYLTLLGENIINCDDQDENIKVLSS